MHNTRMYVHMTLICFQLAVSVMTSREQFHCTLRMHACMRAANKHAIAEGESKQNRPVKWGNRNWVKGSGQ